MPQEFFPVSLRLIQPTDQGAESLSLGFVS
jgi:hypothetical protein